MIFNINATIDTAVTFNTSKSNGKLSRVLFTYWNQNAWGFGDK